MAQIQFTAFVEPWTKNSEQHPSWGMKTAETHRKKDGENWVDNGRTFRTVKVGFGVELDLTQFAKGDRVDVVGTEVTESREHDGKKFYDLVVKATSVTRTESARSAPQRPAAASTGQPGTPGGSNGFGGSGGGNQEEPWARATGSDETPF